ncbi:hypothetical protein [Kribbella jiaozuonensis]|uniref:Uncharacterized protein n=1 Tax=Kribbella jiaozuonensis TaxID=2575441 RepID=A0A4U3LQ43_9ACTN|nr:hypothetical protein [Kribbella jiaozuonensis]TKK78011.1 hypothetical protein FDA38_23195 [Kribbella jiaozuonensis]
MMKRSQRIVATVVLAALATTGTAAAQASGPDPKPGAAKSGAAKAGAATKDGKSKPTADAEFAAIAAKLGVTSDRLVAALVAAKRSFTGKTTVTPQAFAAAVAADLGLPVARVKAAVEPLLLKPGRPRAGDKNDKGKEGADDRKNSPFTSNAAAASLASKLGVSQAKAKAALAKLVATPGGITPTSKSFRQIAASLGVSTDRLMVALGELKQSLAKG